MRVIGLLLLFVLLPLAVMAEDRITVIISVTNAPIGNTNTLTVNSDTRTWTNSVTGSPGTLVQETNSIPWTATNLIDHLTDYPFTAGHYLSQQASNEVRITGLVGQAMAASLAGGWAVITYSTQTVSTPTFAVRVPITAEASSNQTSIASLLVAGMSSLSTNAFATNSTAVTNLLVKGAVPAQTVSGAVTFGGLSGGIGNLTNGYWTNGIAENLTVTNLSSPGTGTTSLQLGSGAAATNTSSLAVGVNALAGGSQSVAVGNNASNYFAAAIAMGDHALSSNLNSIAIGYYSIASGAQSIRIGSGTPYSSRVTGDFAIGIGRNIVNDYESSIAIGNGATTTASNQFMMGTSVTSVSIPGLLSAASQTNSTLRGTNILNGRLDLTASTSTSLANGNNSGVILGTNVYLQLSGATTIAAIAGFAAEQNGSYHVLQISGAVTNTLYNDSGIDATAANRIYTGTGADISMTNSPSFCTLIYDSAASRWRVVSHSN